MRPNVPTLAALLTVAPCLGPSPAPAVTVLVPDSVATVSGALALASAGDTVLVAPGTYLETITMVDGVALLGVTPGPRPILDGSAAGTVVTVDSCGSTTLIRGFVIRNGLSAAGGGADVRTSSLTFEDCRFEDNGAVHGGGLAGDGSAFALIDCELVSNTASESGGALSVTALPSPAITACRFTDNEALVGGAIAVRNACAPEIGGSVMEGNRASLGAALWYDFFAGGEVTGCTIVFSDAQAAGGGALYFNSLSAPLVTENIVAFGVSGGAVSAVSGAGAVLGCNDVFGNVGGDSLGAVTDLGTNISADPLFCDGANGNYWLHSDSPCLPDGPCGLMGAFGSGDCELVPVTVQLEISSWTRIKARYRR